MVNFDEDIDQSVARVSGTLDLSFRDRTTLSTQLIIIMFIVVIIVIII